MAEFSYAGLMRGLEAFLRDADAMEDVDIAQGKEPPTTDQCPAVRLVLRRVTRETMRIGQAAWGAAPDDLRIQIAVQVWEFSGQGRDDAARRRDTVLQAVVDVLRADLTLGGLCQCLFVRGIDFDEHTQGESAFASGTLDLECWAQA